MRFPTLPDDHVASENISFDAVDVDPPVLDEIVLVPWLLKVANVHGYAVSSLSYVLCSDDYLHQMNVERLNHDTLTDIITFDLSDPSEQLIDGECYISIDRVSENAVSFGSGVRAELYRVLVHGLLHLCGLRDKTDLEILQMRAAEESALCLLLK